MNKKVNISALWFIWLIASLCAQIVAAREGEAFDVEIYTYDVFNADFHDLEKGGGQAFVRNIYAGILQAVRYSSPFALFLLLGRNGGRFITRTKQDMHLTAREGEKIKPFER